MATLNRYLKRAMRASTLIEVLIALIILLSVFAVGMLIFTRLVNTATSERQLQASATLKQLRAAYIAGNQETLQAEQVAGTAYRVEEKPLAENADRKRIVFMAYDAASEQLIDSLIVILPRDEE